MRYHSQFSASEASSDLTYYVWYNSFTHGIVVYTYITTVDLVEVNCIATLYDLHQLRPNHSWRKALLHSNIDRLIAVCLRASDRLAPHKCHPPPLLPPSVNEMMALIIYDHLNTEQQQQQSGACLHLQLRLRCLHSNSIPSAPSPLLHVLYHSNHPITSDFFQSLIRFSLICLSSH